MLARPDHRVGSIHGDAGAGSIAGQIFCSSTHAPKRQHLKLGAGKADGGHAL